MHDNICRVPECGKPARSASAELCSMHYHRQYRHGSVTRQANQSSVTVSYGRRYRNVYRPGHPVSGVRGMAYEHRINLFDRIGPGEHRCHWCGTVVSWQASKSSSEALQVDHLNNIGDDNAPDNLVPACRRCNTARGAQRRHAALRAAGYWSGHDTVARTAQGRVAPVEPPAGVDAVTT